jgi:hypothetical protein
VVSARITSYEDIKAVILSYHSEGTASFSIAMMTDDGAGHDLIAGDSLFTGTIPGASNGTMRAFYIEAIGSEKNTRFPASLDAAAQLPDRTCLVRVGDSLLDTQFATYRIWMSNDVIDTFRNRLNLSNELMDCTFVYNNNQVFYNTRIRLRGSPFMRGGGVGRDPLERWAYRIDFNPDQRFGCHEEINLDNTDSDYQGPLQERVSYWFYRQMGLQYSRQEYIHPIINGHANGVYENVQKIDGDYITQWFPGDTDGMLHKIDDYWEENRYLDEGLIYDEKHSLLPETYRWGFEKRSHRENDTWDHVFELALNMNTPATGPGYEQNFESVIDPEHFARVLAVRRALGDWDSYGYDRGKNNYFYYALPEGKWYLLPWDIDRTLGSGRSANADLFSVGSHFPEVKQFLGHPKYRQMYLRAFLELINGPWQTSEGTDNPPTAFDEFLDDAASALMADGFGSGRRDSIRQFVRDRRAYILTQIPPTVIDEVVNVVQ